MDPSERSRSLWKATSPLLERTALVADTHVEVCVVGAGIAGLSVAYELARRGLRVVVLDDGPIGGGETAQTTAHLASALDDRFQRLEDLHGARGARLAGESHRAAIDRIESITQTEQIDCGFSRLDGYLFLGDGDHPSTLERESDAATRAGFQGLELMADGPPGLRLGPCLRFPRQGQLQPLAYLQGLVRAIERDGGTIHTGSHVTRVQGGKEVIVETEVGATVRARAAVVATNVPVNDRLRIHGKQEAYRTFVLSIQVMSPLPRGLYWDTSHPYHYVRLHESHDGTWLLVGGEDHPVGAVDDAPARFARLETWARGRFPGLGSVGLRWSGQIIEPFDGLAFIGQNPMDRNVYVATGDSGHGMTHGTLAGMILADAVTGMHNPWRDLYSPSRKTLRAAHELARMAARMALQYGDWVTGGEVESVDDVPRGAGAVVRDGLRKVAVCRDERGNLSACAAKCTHLGGVVRWNGEARSWDCPVHGSRFAASGEVQNGPASRPLAPAEVPEARPVPVTEGEEQPVSP